MMHRWINRTGARRLGTRQKRGSPRDLASQSGESDGESFFLFSFSHPSPHCGHGARCPSHVQLAQRHGRPPAPRRTTSCATAPAQLTYTSPAAGLSKLCPRALFTPPRPPSSTMTTTPRTGCVSFKWKIKVKRTASGRLSRSWLPAGRRRRGGNARRATKNKNGSKGERLSRCA